MEAPQSAIYTTRDELVTAIKTFTARHGYAVTIKRSKPGKIWFKCDRGGAYRNRYRLEDDDRKRTTGSRAINCPFSVTGTLLASGEWQLLVPHGEHNHKIASTLLAHPSLRRLDTHQIESVRQMTAAGQAPRLILAALTAGQTADIIDTDVNITLQDLYNLRQQFRREELGARTPIQALLDQLVGGNIFHRYQIDPQGHITHLFIAHPRSVRYCRSATAANIS